LTYQWIESKSGPPRKYYRISESGMDYLSQLENAWEAMTKTVNEIKNKENQTIIS